MSYVNLHQYKALKISDSIVGFDSAWSSSKLLDYLNSDDFDGEGHSVILRRGTIGEMFEASLRDYEVVFTTDTNETFVYTNSGAKLIGGCVVGLLEDRPAPVIEGRLYFASDEFVLYVVKDGVWLQLTYSADDISSHIEDAAPHSKHATLDDNDKVIENPASATTVPTAGAIPISLQNSRIDMGWLPDVDAGVLI